MLKKMKKATWKVLAETFHVAFLQNAIKRGFAGSHHFQTRTTAKSLYSTINNTSGICIICYYFINLFWVRK